MIDTHVHVISPDRESYPLRQASWAGVDWADHVAWFTERSFSVDRCRAEMSVAGVAGAVLVQPVAAYDDDNAYALEGARSDPKALAAVPFLHAGSAGSRHELARLCEAGVRGFRFMVGLTSRDVAFGAPQLHRLLETSRELDLTAVCTLREEHLGGLHGWLGDHEPDLRLVLDHAGQPRWPEGSAPPEALTRLAELPGVLVKVTSINLHVWRSEHGDARRAVDALVSTFGPDRIVWGSNHPASGSGDYGRLVDLAREAFANLSDADRRLIFEETPRRVWWGHA